MRTLLKILSESITMAFQQLAGNKLRTFLSLLGITIGIWCVIMVNSAVDSMEASIRQSFQKLGDDVIYIDKFSWAEDPGQNYWKWMRRPNPNFKDYQALKELPSADMVTYSVFIGGKTAEYKSSNVQGAFCISVTEDYANLFNLGFEKGRFFTEAEYRMAKNQVVLGYTVAKELFGEIEPVGKKIKIMGRKCTVIGVLEEAGRDLINPLNFDGAVLLSYEFARKITNLKESSRRGGSINVKAAEGIPLAQLKDDIIGVLRGSRRLKPKTENNFALNTLSIISNALDSVFGVLGTAGWVIGGFSIFVGMFSVANIMFVSVRERTSIIGVKMALGAKRYFIMLEFLIEAIILCLIGGLLGILLVWLVSYLVTSWFGFEVFLSNSNIITGLVVSIITGLLAGIIPAAIASRMDPVVAIRQ